MRLRKSLFTSKNNYGWSIFIFWVPCVHKRREGLSTVDQIFTHCLGLYLSQFVSPGITLALPMKMKELYIVVCEKVCFIEG